MYAGSLRVVRIPPTGTADEPDGSEKRATGDFTDATDGISPYLAVTEKSGRATARELEKDRREGAVLVQETGRLIRNRTRIGEGEEWTRSTPSRGRTEPVRQTATRVLITIEHLKPFDRGRPFPGSSTARGFRLSSVGGTDTALVPTVIESQAA
jgi:hypothetical protein